MKNTLHRLNNIGRSFFRDKSPVDRVEHSGHAVAKEGQADMRLRRRLIGQNPDVVRLAKGTEILRDEG